MILLKYADDMDLVAHIDGGEALTQYQVAVDDLLRTFNEKSLELNV